MGLPIICNVGGARPGSSTRLSMGPAISCFGGGLPVFVVLLMNDACKLFLPSPSSSILFLGSMAACSFPCWLIIVLFVGGNVLSSKVSFFLFVCCWITMATKILIKVALDSSSNILDKGSMSCLNLTLRPSADSLYL